MNVKPKNRDPMEEEEEEEEEKEEEKEEEEEAEVAFDAAERREEHNMSRSDRKGQCHTPLLAHRR